MDPTCTCGAVLPPDAQFCPRCGRPLAETPSADDVHQILEAAQTPLEPEAPAAPIGFGNPDALRSTYLGAALSAFLSNLPLVSFLCFIWYPAAGFLSVHQYRKRTGTLPPPSGGARLGWMTGLFSFVISLTILAFGVLFIGDGGFEQVLRQSLENAPMQEEMRRQMADLLNNPMTIALILFVGLFITFLVAVGFTAIGGALAAKVLEKD